MKDFTELIKNIRRERILPAAVMLLFGLCVAALLSVYFNAWRQPYMMKEVITLSEGFEYQTDSAKRTPIANLGSGPFLRAGVKMSIYRVLDTQIKDAAIMVRANHQTINIYLNDEPLYIDRLVRPGENPGMSLIFVLLPDDYMSKTLRLDITSPYEAYSGRTSPIMMGTIPSLESFAISRSMRSLVLMSMCLLLGICVILLSFVQVLGGDINHQNPALGIFAVVWALYYICTEYVVYHFLSPTQVSTMSLALYYSFAAPLTLYFYFSFKYYKKWMLPAAILHCVFPATALFLQFTGAIQLPQLLNLNNILLGGLAYTLALTFMEAIRGNKMMRLSSVFLTVAYISMLYNFAVFYSRNGAVPYTYRDTYFLFILSVLVLNTWQFYGKYHKEQRANEALVLENRLAWESCDRIQSHLREVGGLKHEIRKHFAALKSYLDGERIDEAKSYLLKYADQSAAVIETAYHENFVVNAVVGRLLSDASERGVDVALDLTAGIYNIAGPDLYSLLSNMIENAMQACEAIPNGLRKFITLSLSREGSNLLIICQNSKAGETNAAGVKPHSSKHDDTLNHSVWMIGHIAHSYGGNAQTKYDEDEFTLTVTLKDKTE